VENLATNAVKYSTPDTAITITIQQSDSKVILSVHNQGNPIALNEQDTLFQQFRRKKSAETQVGWGLGLTVVKGITESHSGTVRIESSDEKGTSFIIELPRDARIPENSSK
jgi:signal transduction histidine kinase